MKNTEPFHADAETYIAVRKFLAAFSQIYQDEREQIEAIKETMRPLLDRELLVVVDDNDKFDGVIMQPCCPEVFLRNVLTQILGNNRPKVADTVNG